MDREKLKNVLSDHRLWLHTKGMRGLQADLTRGNLSGINLKRADLESALLAEVNPFGSNLSDACLEKANLTRSILVGSNLERANLLRANMEGCKLTGSNLRGANLTGVNLENSDLDSAIMIDSYLIETNFNKANLNNAVLANCWIDHRTFTGLPKDLIDLYGDTMNLIGGSLKRHSIVRSIEFPPEYLQAGISIMHFFGEYLGRRYPNQKVKVTIEQEGLKVFMIIDTLEGEPEVVEKALNEYGLVITGRTEPEDVIDDPLLIVSMKNEISIANVRLECQRELLEFAKGQLSKFQSLLSQAINKPAPRVELNVPIKAEASASSFQVQGFEIAKTISEIQRIILELTRSLPPSAMSANALQDVHDSLEKVKNKREAGELAKSPELSKFKRFLKQISDKDSDLGRLVRGVKKGAKLAQDLARYYNQIAQWGGLPIIPEPLLGQNSNK
jgi:uncharacterized protein YjbI with pentapeptide repeats